MEKMLETLDLCFSYRGGDPVLTDVSLSLGKGEVGALLGQNGAGKSTLLKLCAGLLKPTSGRVLYDGADVASMGGMARAKLAAYVEQRPAFSDVSVFESVLTGRYPYFRFAPSGHDREVVSSVLRRMGISHLADRSIRTLSGGEAQKVAVARALAQEPKLLLLDEPTGNLDLAARARICDLVTTAKREFGVCVLLSVHDVSLAMTLADRLLFLSDGKLCTANPGAVTEELLREVYGVPVGMATIDGATVIYSK